MASLADDVLIVTFNGLSKNYRACGYRSGWLFVAGDEHRVDSRQRAFAQVLCQWRELHFGFVAEWLDCADCLALMTRLFNDGHLVFADAG
jgi:aspartate/methionine/tyrosine aminotransferase